MTKLRPAVAHHGIKQSVAGAPAYTQPVSNSQVEYNL